MRGHGGVRNVDRRRSGRLLHRFVDHTDHDFADRLAERGGFLVSHDAPARLAANIVFDHDQTVDDMAERAVNHFESVLGAGDIVFEIGDAG